MDQRCAGKEQPDQSKVRLIERHLVGEPGSPRRHDSQLRDLAQVMVAQIVQVVAMISHPEFGERFRVGERAVQHARHQSRDFVHERQFVSSRDARMRGQGLFQQRGARTGEPQDEDRLRGIGANARARQGCQPLAREEAA